MLVVNDRESHLHAAGAISLLSLTLGLVVGATALVLAVTTGSLVLAAFGVESLVDAGASALLVWRFRVERRDTALYLPPTNMRLVLRSAPLLERVGRSLLPRLAGLTITEAVKDVYAAIPLQVPRRGLVLAEAA